MSSDALPLAFGYLRGDQRYMGRPGPTRRDGLRKIADLYRQRGVVRSATDGNGHRLPFSVTCSGIRPPNTSSIQTGLCNISPDTTSPSIHNCFYSRFTPFRAVGIGLTSNLPTGRQLYLQTPFILLLRPARRAPKQAMGSPAPSAEFKGRNFPL